MNEKVLGLVSGVRDGKQLLVTTPKRCSATAAGDLYLGLVSGTRDGKPLLVVSDFVCDAGALAVGQTYLGLVSGIRDGKPLLVVPCGDCGGVTSCGCDICCTLDATVQVGSDADAYAFTDPLDVPLTCGGAIQYNQGHICINDENPEDYSVHKLTVTLSEKNTLGSPEAYGGLTSGTREVKTDIWSSGDFDIEGVTYRLSFWQSEGTVYQTLPTVATTPFCIGGWALQRLETTTLSATTYGPYWVVHSGTVLLSYLTTASWTFTVSDDDVDCGAGYSDPGTIDAMADLGCDQHAGGLDPYTSGGTVDQEACPVYLLSEQWYRLNADPDDDAHRLKCAKIMIADLC